MIKTATLLDVSRVTVSKVMSAYTTHHGKTISTKRNCGRESTLTERDRRILRRIVPRNHRTTAVEVTGEQNWIFIFMTLFPQKLSYVRFTNPTFMAGLQLLNFRLLKVMLRRVNDGVTTIKPGHQTTGNARVIWSDGSSFTLFPASGRVYVWWTPNEACNPECLLPTITDGGACVMVWQQYNGTVFCWSHYYPSWPNYCAEIHRQVG
jgi:hypothetical protein